MNASEPVMDAVKKVARALYEIQTSDTCDQCGLYEYEEHEYMNHAHALVAAFPQLALEGREEWGIQFRDYNVSQVTNRERGVDLASNGEEGVRAMRRLVFESLWSEVQS